MPPCHDGFGQSTRSLGARAGVRRLLVGNYYAYYRIAEDEGRVYVLNVIYARASQRGLSDGGQNS